jgi:hypothetical protein
MSAVARQAYTARLFVGREEEINKVLDKAKKLCHNQSDPQDGRVTIFDGEVGLGKTWLLKRIFEALQEPPYQEKLVTYWIELSQPHQKAGGAYDPVEHVRSIMLEFGRAVLDIPLHEGTLPAASRQLIEELDRWLAGRCLALFIDEVYDANWDFLELFEEYFLGPLAIDPRILVTLAGRGRKFPFSTPELRLYAESDTLRPFEPDKTLALVERYNSAVVSEVEQIQALSQGVPLTASYLARHPDALRLPDTGHLDTMISYMLEPVSPHLRVTVRAALEALCVLQAFRDEQMVQTLLDTYTQTSRGRSLLAGTEPLPPSDEVVKMLVYQGMARYEVGLGAYVLDEHLCHLVRSFLPRCEPDQQSWQTLHRTALDLYKLWTAKYEDEDSKAGWSAEIEYHKKAIASISLA